MKTSARPYVDPEKVSQRTVSANGAAALASTGARSVFDVAKDAAKAAKKSRATLPPLNLAAIKVEKGVAIPEVVKRANPLHELLDRLLIDTSAKLPIAYKQALSTAIGSFTKKQPARKFTVRTSETDVRVWRTA